MSSWTAFISTQPPNPTNNFLSTTGTFDSTGGTAVFPNVDFNTFPAAFFISLPTVDCRTSLDLGNGGAFVRPNCETQVFHGTGELWTFTSSSLGSSNWVNFFNFSGPNATCDLVFTYVL